MHYLLYLFFYLPFSDFSGEFPPACCIGQEKSSEGVVSFILETWVWSDVVVLAFIFRGEGYMV